ncbi:helix-turn-helix domain-containing protein [Paenibacillaceae bacterium WGS1546]|uniref:helix-turn-helix domain-containing protein n=1 Tax=Cohnella sp. WGS1546 TaxID=3366810 RepID=UPI00372CF9ED
MFKRIRVLREDKDWTQKEIADLLKVNQTTYSRYESGELDLPTSALIKLADLHQTSVDYLLNRTDRKEPYPPKKK